MNSLEIESWRDNDFMVPYSRGELLEIRPKSHIGKVKDSWYVSKVQHLHWYEAFWMKPKVESSQSGQFHTIVKMWSIHCPSWGLEEGFKVTTSNLITNHLQFANDTTP